MTNQQPGALFASVTVLALALPGCGGSNDSSAEPPIDVLTPDAGQHAVIVNVPATNAVLSTLGIAAIAP
jgi:hypothetical protein